MCQLGGYISAQNVDLDTSVKVITCEYDGEEYAALQFSGDNLNDGSYFYGMYNTVGTQAKFRAVDGVDVLLTNVVTFNNLML